MKLLYQDKSLCVCVKPIGVVSTDLPGGVPALARKALKGGSVWTVHRLDQVVGGVMVLARNPSAAKALSAQMTQGSFGKIYLAVVQGSLPEDRGRWCDRLWRSKEERKSYVLPADDPRPSQEAVLDYEVLARLETQAGQGFASLVRVTLQTGRTHQIRAQFAGHGHPLVGDFKYGAAHAEGMTPALWSHALSFRHPATQKPMTFTLPPPKAWPWTEFFDAKKA